MPDVNELKQTILELEQQLHIVRQNHADRVGELAAARQQINEACAEFGARDLKHLTDMLVNALANYLKAERRADALEDMLDAIELE